MQTVRRRGRARRGRPRFARRAYHLPPNDASGSHRYPTEPSMKRLPGITASTGEARRVSGSPRARPRWRAWLSPAPDSVLAVVARQGRPLWTEWVHLLWTSWVFTTPLFTPRGYDLQWALITLASYP